VGRVGQVDREVEPPSVATGLGRAWRAARLVGSIYLFVGALQILKTGASDFQILHEGGVLVRNAGSTLGLGWLGAMLTLSGSTMAATALTLRATGAISEVQGFTMVTGARLGAAFVVLLVATIYALREGRRRRKTLSTAVLALTITAVIYVPGAAIGLFVLRSPPFRHIHIRAPAEFAGVIDILYDWILVRVESWPGVVLFVIGVVLLVLSFRFIDALVPELDEERLQGSRLEWLRGKWAMFLLGIVVVIATMSVSVALTILVPLVAKGYVRRENLVPYIVGADLGTLVDKLLIAFVAGVGAAHPASPVRIILAELVGTASVGLVIMAFFYEQMSRGVWQVQRYVTRDKLHLAVFTGSVLLIPVLLIAVSALV
jgi:solute carrier family 34 (sodium-dependent phosphate cotransporter)